jgi:hypothetical protein
MNEDPYNIIEKELKNSRTTSGKSAVEVKRKTPVFSEKRQASAPSTSPNKAALSKPQAKA